MSHLSVVPIGCEDILTTELNVSRLDCRTAWCAGRAACAQPSLETLVLQKKSLITGESQTVHSPNFYQLWWLDKSLSSLCFFPTFYLFCLIPGIVFSHFSDFFYIFFISQHCIIWECWGQRGSSKPQIPFMGNDIHIVGCHWPSARCVSSSAGSNLQWHLSGTFFYFEWVGINVAEQLQGKEKNWGHEQ